MPDGVDAGVQPVQAAGGESMVDGAALEAQFHELRPRDHPVLTGGERGDRLVDGGRAEMSMHLMDISARPNIRPPR